ncbi:SDR family NAD(P)-dependent oxidoreductase [Marinagarivorans cellulosilyticus]|uniref:Dihydroanticapsin dehydrogenase n=1 Tax=Marinagarivorans cellulosilyticus TaxID=2721545 RepID=A0AAN2BKD2_9GAMM|nr:SDR family oxidoreductase [Marinagarivorans cellulosilyticus]BCD97860.1 dihydroanticapsin dehydrogenase [Marinagarivorans cellulosilyticus]
MSFSKKVAIVTGGSTGIGREVVLKLCAQGAKVYNLDIVDVESDACSYIACDVSNYEQVEKAVAQVLDESGRVDLLFANAGIHLFANIEQTSVDEFERVLAVNCKGVFFTLKAVLPIMKEQRQGKVLIMGSDQSFVGKGMSAAYGMTKGAVAQLTKSTAIDYAEFNISINCICPGTIDTPLLHKAVDKFKSITGASDGEVMAILEDAQPIKRIAEPAEIARVACFLLSDENSFMTGALVPVDGGYTCQ